MAAAYPVSMKLRYLVSARWLEEQILAGEISAAPERDFEVQFDRLDPELRDRALALATKLDFRPYARTGSVRVAGTGLDPEATVVRDGFRYNACQSVAAKIGKLPKLDEPAEDAETIVKAYEAWLCRYEDIAFGALTRWFRKTAPEGAFEDDEGEDIDLGKNSRDLWEQRIPLGGSDGRVSQTVSIDGRSEPELFQRARGAQQRRAMAAGLADAEDSELAFQILGMWPELPKEGPDQEAVVAVFEEHCRRAADLMLARYWHRQQQKAGFALEMLRWIAEHGSERLKLGVDDGYRMMPVYLSERIALEAPRFFAHLPKDGEPKLWQPRTGPSEEALRLRRAVQERMNVGQFPGRPTPKVEIGWVKSPPEALYDREARRIYDPYDEDRLRDDAFEVIVVPDWLGRYALIGAVWTLAEEQPPGYIHLKFVLRPKDYGLDDLPAPPPMGTTVAEGIEIAARAARPTSDDDIPF